MNEVHNWRNDCWAASIDGRAALLLVSPEIVVQLATTCAERRRFIIQVAENALPEGTRAIGVTYLIPKACFAIIVTHAGFGITAADQELPVLPSPVFKREIL